MRQIRSERNVPMVWIIKSHYLRYTGYSVKLFIIRSFGTRCYWAQPVLGLKVVNKEPHAGRFFYYCDLLSQIFFRSKTSIALKHFCCA